MNDDKTPRDTSLMERIQESPRTVSALIIILIVAAAIYAFSGNRDQDTTPGTTDEARQTALEEGEDGETAQPNASPAVTVTPAARASAASTTLPPARQTEQGYEEVAQPGEGVTHLARRATSQWLNGNNAGYDVTKEHRIYVEDYIKDKLGSTGLAVGEQKLVTNDLIKEAVESAKTLNEGQLKNLSRYTYVLS